jgi:hypothetical protein
MIPSSAVLVGALCSYALCYVYTVLRMHCVTYALCSYALCSYTLCSYTLCSYALCSYALCYVCTVLRMLYDMCCMCCICCMHCAVCTVCTALYNMYCAVCTCCVLYMQCMLTPYYRGLWLCVSWGHERCTATGGVNHPLNKHPLNTPLSKPPHLLFQGLCCALRSVDEPGISRHIRCPFSRHIRSFTQYRHG